MKKFKKMLAWLLALSMVAGYLPANTMTAEAANDKDYLFLATDRHTNTSILATMINAMEDDIGENELDYLGLGGDMVGSGNNHPEYNSSTVLSEITGATTSLSATNVDIVAGIHDMNVNDDAGIVLPYSGGGAQIYEGNNYYVYGVPESCISGDVSGVDPETEANDFVTWANGSDIDKSKVIIVLSHYPLHQRRNDNDGASYWATALNKVAVGDDTSIDRNIAFFWGHNHTSESSADTAVYHVAPNGSISVQGGSSSQTIYFTYANAGYLNSHSSATLVTITDDTITFDKYKNSSVSTTNSVERVVTETVTLSSITVSGTKEYSVGDELALTVTANYSDGSTKDVTADATISNVDMTTAGTKTVTVTYGDLTETYEITVKDTVNTVTSGTTYEDTEGTLQENGDEISATALGLTGVTAVFNETDLSDTYDDSTVGYSVYDVSLEGYKGDDVNISFNVYDADLTGATINLVGSDGTLTEVTGTTELKETEDGVAYTTISFTIPESAVTDGAFTVSFGMEKTVIPSDYTLEKIEITKNPETVKYFVGENTTNSENLALDITDLEVTATFGNGTDSSTKVISWNEFNEEADGYALSFDMTQIGAQDVKVSYTYGEETKETSFAITIYNKQFTLADTDIVIEVTVPGVTEATAVESTNENVESAIEYVINGDNYVAYDIELTGYNNGEEVNVTLPVPETMTNPVVYYVPDTTANAVKMDAEVSEDGKTITFVTDHFSTYVLGDGTTIETESGTATQPGTEESETTKYVANEETVYKLVATPESGKQYLIVNSATGTGYGLDGDTTGYATTAFTGGDDYYSSWDNASQTGTAFSAGSDVYLTTDGAYLWTAGSNSFTIGYDRSSSSNSGGLGGGTYSYTLNPANKTAAWTLSNAQLSINLQTAYKGLWGDETYADFYLTNSGSTWGMATSSAANVYFYEPVTIYTLTEETETTPATPAITYSVEGIDITDAKALENQTVTLSSVLNSTPEDGTTSDITESSGITPTYEVVTTKGNPDVIAKDGDGNYLINGNVATLSGTVGTAVVKVTYTSGDLTAWDEFIVTTTAISDELYAITMHKQTTDADGNPVAGDEITAPITIKNIQNGMQDSVWAVVKADGTDLGALGDKLTWTISGDPIGTIDPVTGVVTFNGTEGTATVTAYYTCPGGRVIQASVTYSVTLGNYTVPEDGTEDFPEYPDPGAIRFDKHAIAVGNFSETGITQVELSMTGVPYGTDTAIDVVVMLDMTGSMSDNGMEAAEEATKAFVKKIVQNDDGTYNDNRVAVYAFNSGSSSPYELVALSTIDSDTELETANTAIDTASDKQTSGGTPFDEAAQKCHDVLAAAKTDGTGNNRKQFCVFMSDGGPTTYEGSDGYTYYGGNASGDRAITSYIGGYTSSSSSDWTYNLPTEYWTDDMKADGVTVYSVGLLLQSAPSNPSPYSSMTDSTYDSATDSLTTIGSHYYFTSTILKNMASDTNKYIDIFNVDNASKATAAFENIAQSILDAATDVKVTDKIASDYTMVFEAPNATVGAALPSGQEMYIEVKDYVLNPVYGSDGTTIVDYTRGTAASLMKLYLGKNGTTYYAASDANGTAYAAPTFNQTAIGTMYYWTTTATSSGVSVTVDGTTYYFDEAGISNKDEDFVAANWFNMASGAYASGNITTTNIVDETTGETTTNSVCNDLIIATPYFVYNASTKMLTWTAEKLSTSELTLSYFLYLDESGGYSGAENETPAGTYETNEYAHLSYTNFQGTDCQQTFPVPQMTWNGAQVSYVFYLVNDQGQPVNRAGKVVPFSEAVYVTDVFTHSIVWNDLEQVASLEAEYLAEDLVPSVYSLYDAGASYNIHVFEDEEGQNLNNHFIISSSSSTYTTYVFNTKADATKYKTPGTYAATSTYKCKEYVEGGQYTDDNGAYNIVEKTGASVVETGFDFSNTTVAFAVTWTPGLVEDTVVVDYGLDVVIDVIKNDNMAAGVVGVRTTAPSGVTTEGTYDRVAADTLTSVDLYIDSNNDEAVLKENKIGTASVENLSSVRFSLDKTNGMQFTDPAEFYYEADVNYYVNDELKTTSMYSKVTVIPATTIYYEDNYVDFKVYESVDSNGNVVLDTNNKRVWTLNESHDWATDGTATNSTQDTDRPGESKISEAIDADNVYGYDSAYDNCSKYSLGSARKLTVNENRYGTAEFEFYGTGFDVIALTSNNTGTITVQVQKVASDGSLSKVKNFVVDTYYSYVQNDNGEWVVDNTKENPLYQVPVIESDLSEFGYNHYKVTIKAAYNTFFDHVDGSSDYDMYIDAIRIYDPANDGVTNDGVTNDVVKNAYLADGEAYPEYIEVRNNVIDAAKLLATETNDETINGVVFIDGDDATASVTDYTNNGPNNELYLKKGQSIAFSLANNELVKDVQIGLKSADGEAVSYSISGKSGTLNTSTGMYYSIYDLRNSAIVITNTSTDESILSITDIKMTFTTDPYATEEAFEPLTLFSVSRAMVDEVVESFVEDPEIVSVTTDKESYTVADTVMATVTTNVATTYITVNGETITEFEESGDTRIWTLSTKAEKIGKLTFTVVAYNEIEEVSEEVSTTVDVKKFAPKTFKLVLNKKTVIVGEKIKATVTTSTDVKYVTINGKKITKYTSNKAKGTRTWTAEYKAVSTGKKTFKAVAYNKNDSASKTISATAIAKKFAPKTFKLYLSKSSVKVGQKYTVSVTTSTDVKYVTVNGKKITKYTTNKNKTLRTFKITYTAKTTSKKTVKAIAYNKNGAASNSKTKSVTVKKSK